MEPSCWKISLLTISSQMVLSEKSTQNDVALIMTDDSVGMRHETQLVVLLLPEGSDQPYLCGSDQAS